MPRPAMFVVDLDGTLLSSSSVFGAGEKEALRQLRADGVLIMVATGRSWRGVDEVLSADDPIDYVAFSSGAGLVRWSDRKLLRSRSLSAAETETVIELLDERACDFMVHETIPNNHRFYTRRNQAANADYERRVARRRPYALDWSERPVGMESCEVLVIVPPNEAFDAEQAQRLFPNLSIVRATSPLDHESTWVEIFPTGVSKSEACAFVADEHEISATDVAGVGNDYNDVDFLRWCGRPFAVANSALPLLKEFESVASNDDGGVAEAVARCR